MRWSLAGRVGSRNVEKTHREADPEEGVPVHPVRDFAGVVRSVQESHRSVRKIDLDLDHLLAFNPGQYVLVRLPAGAATDGCVFCVLEAFRWEERGHPP